MEFIRECNQKWIIKDSLHFIETNLMLLKVYASFIRIPLEDEFHIEIIALSPTPAKRVPLAPHGTRRR